MHPPSSETEKRLMQAINYEEISKTVAHKPVATCSKCGDTEFTHQDQEFGGTMARIVFCSTCGASIGVVLAI
jgi:ribosomal protein S27AE